MSNYYPLSQYFKEQFGQRVHKISVDAGFSCPNRDGSKGVDGCVFCDNKSFNFIHRQAEEISLEQQIETGMKFAARRFHAKKFFVFFQSFSNTYDNVENLRKKYDVIKKFDNIVGIAISTRPDCIDNEKLDLICEYKKDYDIWMEYGVQSIHNETLNLINRHHKYEDFIKAYNLTRERDINVCAHIILGLPSEDESMMLETIKELARIKIQGIKFHPLHIIKDTPLETMHSLKKCDVLELNKYIELVAKCIAYLPKETVIHRIGAYTPKDFLVSPVWVGQRIKFNNLLDQELTKKHIFQGNFSL